MECARAGAAPPRTRARTPVTHPVHTRGFGICVRPMMAMAKSPGRRRKLTPYAGAGLRAGWVGGAWRAAVSAQIWPYGHWYMIVHIRRVVKLVHVRMYSIRTA